MMKIINGDHREEPAQSCSEPSLASAPLSIISILDIERTRPEGYDDFSSEELRWLWYYEAGSCAQNTMLVASAWDLTGNIEEISIQEKTRSLLRLNDNFIPLFVMPVGFSTT